MHEGFFTGGLHSFAGAFSRQGLCKYSNYEAQKCSPPLLLWQNCTVERLANRWIVAKLSPSSFRIGFKTLRVPVGCYTSVSKESADEIFRAPDA